MKSQGSRSLPKMVDNSLQHLLPKMVYNSLQYPPVLGYLMPLSGFHFYFHTSGTCTHMQNENKS
ncbi:mCG57033, partial [Mus musculus]